MSKQNELKAISFFISSTFEDLKIYRSALIDKINKHKGIIKAQEFFGARSNKSLQTCLDEVNKSDVFILIIAHRYGTVYENGSSFTELEYEQALKEKKTIFVYIIDKDYLWKPDLIDKDENFKKLQNFIDRVKKDFTVDFFSTPENLSEKVFKDLIRELPNCGFAIGKINKELDLSSNINIINNFNLLPKLYDGIELCIICKVGETKKVDINLCYAFNLEYGSSIKRKIIPVDEEIRKLLTGENGYIYAEYEKAKELLDFSNEEEMKLRIKTKYGYYFREMIKEELIDTDLLRENNFLTSSLIGIFSNGPKKKIINNYFEKKEFVEGYIYKERIIEKVE